MLKLILKALDAVPTMNFQGARTIPLEQLKEKYQLDDSHFININGLDVHYRDSPCITNPEAPILLCLHGIFSSLHTWQKWTDELNERFHIISIDLPNFGLTGPFPQAKANINDDTYPDFLRDFLSALNIQKCHIAGNSLGGYFSYTFAAKYPEHIEKMILLNPTGFLFMPPAALIAWGAPLGAWVVDHSTPPRWLAHSLLRRAYARSERTTKEELLRYYEMLLRSGNRQGGTNILHYVRNRLGFNTQYLKTIQAPTLLMWGEEDHWVPVRHCKNFQQALPHCKVITYVDCGHLPMEEKPELSARDAAEFLLD